MPHEYVLVTRTMPELRQIAHAVAAAGIDLAHRVERYGFHIVLHDPRDATVVTVVHPRPSGPTDELRRLLPGTTAEPGWWTDAIVPAHEEPRAVPVLAHLARLADGVVHDLDTGADAAR